MGLILLDHQASPGRVILGLKELLNILQMIQSESLFHQSIQRSFLIKKIQKIHLHFNMTGEMINFIFAEYFIMQVIRFNI